MDDASDPGSTGAPPVPAGSPAPEGADAPPAPGYPGFWQGIGLLVMVFLGTTIVSAGLVVVDRKLGGEGRLSAGWMVAIANTVGFGGALAIGAGSAGRPLREVFPFRVPPPSLLLTVAILGAPLLLVLTQIVLVIIHPFVGAEESGVLGRFLEEMFRRLFEDPLGFAIAVGVVAPLTEELFFRGLLLGGFLRRYSPGRAVALSAALFALAHMNPVQFVPTFLLGLYLGWLVLRTGDLTLAVVAHAINNLGAFGSLWLNGRTGSLEGEGLAFAPWWLTLAAGGIAVAGFALLRRAFACRP